MSTKQYVNQMEFKYLYLEKGTPIDYFPIENWHALLKKETLYNNNTISLQEYIQLLKEWILFYNTNKLKSKVKKKRKTYTKREK